MCLNIYFTLDGICYQSLTKEKLEAFLEIVKKITGGGDEVTNDALKWAKEGITIIAIHKNSEEVVGYVINTIKVSFLTFFSNFYFKLLLDFLTFFSLH